MTEIPYKVTVRRPVLTEQERERRMQEIRKAVAAIGRAVEQQKRKEEA